MSESSHDKYKAVNVICKLIGLAEERGVPFENLTIPLENRKRGENFADFFLHGCPSMSDNDLGRIKQNYCRRWLGNLYLSVNEISTAFEVEFSVSEKNNLNRTLPSDIKVAQLHGNGYILLPTLPHKVTFADLISLDTTPAYLNGVGKKCDFWESEAIEPNQWLAIKMQEHEPSLEKIFNAQRNLLERGEYIPTAVEMLYAITAYYLVRKQWSFERMMVRTASVGLTGTHVALGRFREPNQDMEPNICISIDTLDRASGTDCGLAVGHYLEDVDGDKELLT